MPHPPKVKFRKQHRPNVKRVTQKVAQNGFWIVHGSFGLKAMQGCFLTENQIEAARKAINGVTNRKGQMWKRIYPGRPMTKKPAEVRMGKGKGAPEYWIAAVMAGTILYELDGLSPEEAKKAMRAGAKKLPIKTKFVVRDGYENDL